MIELTFCVCCVCLQSYFALLRHDRPIRMDGWTTVVVAIPTLEEDFLSFPRFHNKITHSVESHH